ncbi:hypothetical protein BS47DRAFT_1298749 [Hydnum rufescens UP504]|uniref:Actin-like ATPase domain-containing protein n=1 Tax=Hydnum rufescens UP504 TaxID=1448309 RepID=A0A9P6DQW7_9AGAM|nr:hypothetical protein BS47DRAFT_1298749 [Hydnum rufescens UP504]
MVRKLPQPQGVRLYLSVDFGATHSGVSYATSTNGKVIPIVSWPGSSDPLRKIPTCLVYDSLGNVRAWGLEARDINLRRGWIRCEWFKLWLDPKYTISPSLPVGKHPGDVIVDFLSSLWMYVKERILFKYTLDTLSKWDIIAVPASWDAHTSLLLREVAIKAGLAVQVSHEDMYWQERLHIIPETEASAIHSVALARFLPNQKFVICDAGGGTIDIATYDIPRALGMPEIAEVPLRSGSYCGSLFLDVHFRELVRARLADHPSHLDEASLAHFLLTFSGSEKLHYKGSVDDTKMFHFRCLHLQDSDDPSAGLENGKLIIPGNVLRHEVFDPVINQVVRAINLHIHSSRVHVDALLLVGGFSANPYLFQRINDEFKSSVPSIIRPADGDTASNRGAARSGLYPTVTSVIPSQSVVMRVRLPAEPEDKRMRPTYITTSGGTHFCENSRVDVELRKFSAVPSGMHPRTPSEAFTSSSGDLDSIFDTVIYTSNVDETLRYTDQGETNELCLCRVDLKELPSFKEQAMVTTPKGFYTDFELGFEMGTAEIRGELLCKQRKFGSVTFDLCG